MLEAKILSVAISKFATLFMITTFSEMCRDFSLVSVKDVIAEHLSAGYTGTERLKGLVIVRQWLG